MPDAEITTLAASGYRLLGTIGGTGIGLLLVQPATRQGLFSRAGVSILSGVLITPLARWYLEVPREPEVIIATACVVSALSYWAFHGVTAALRSGWLPAAFKRE